MFAQNVQWNFNEVSMKTIMNHFDKNDDEFIVIIRVGSFIKIKMNAHRRNDLKNSFAVIEDELRTKNPSNKVENREVKENTAYSLIHAEQATICSTRMHHTIW